MGCVLAGFGLCSLLTPFWYVFSSCLYECCGIRPLDIYGSFDDYEKLASDLLQGNIGYHPVDGFL